MNKCFHKLVFAVLGSILSYSIINLININLAEATATSDNSPSTISGANFVKLSTTKTSLKIEQTTLINDLINSQQIDNERLISMAKLNSEVTKNHNLELAFIDFQSQTKLFSAKMQNWQNNQAQQTPKPLIEPGILFGLGLISIGGLARKKRL
ncbi:MAG: hypothetical protein QNJ68_08390 [Microcoleaceae cyanobacterium MO_207.B10]|nr:hypothetical protein [Microcoleaceae cyanobacterium MO_207.B10]